jgi:small redox-active disulfide protein 2
MTEVKILGAGCNKCMQLAINAERALKTLDVDYNLEKVTDYAEIVKYKVTSTPAIVLNGKVVSKGKVLKEKDLIKLFS